VHIIDIHDLHHTVHEVFSVDGICTQALYTTLPQEIADFINSTPFSFNAAVQDSFIWANNKSGNYTTKSGYQWLLSLSKIPLMTPPLTALDPGFGGYMLRKNSNSSFG